MKKIYFLFVSVICFNFSLQAFNKDGTILLTARLNGDQEVPKVVTKAKGLVTITVEEDRSLTINGVFDSLSGAITNAHFHKGVFGVSGGVVQNLFQFVRGNRMYGKLANPSKDLLRALLTDSLYVNIHTAANGGGEIRGQVYTQKDYHAYTIMAGAFEVPPVLTATGIGLASVVVSRDLKKASYKVVVHGLSGAITGAHFHYGGASGTGPVAYALTATGNVLQGSVDVIPTFLDSIRLGRVYVNIHTAANPNGEIRGQLGLIAGPLVCDALLDGASELPTPVTTSARGLAVSWINNTLDSIQYAVIYTGLTATAAHFHGGTATQTGGVLQALKAYAVAPNNAFVDNIPITNQNINRFLKDSVYVNIHTAANSGGEIRGQMKTSIHEGVVADLCGKQEVPAVTTNATGAAYASIDPSKTTVYYDVVTTGLSGNATAAHIHKGAKGANGGVYIGFTNIGNNSFTGTATVTTTAADSLRDGLMYFNVHTTANGSGEIRGQAGKALTSDCLPTSLYELNGQLLEAKVYPNPARDMMTLTFQSNQSFDAQMVIYDLVGRSVMQKKIKVENGDNTQQINALNMSSGIYFLQIKTDRQLIFTEKIIKE